MPRATMPTTGTERVSIIDQRQWSRNMRESLDARFKQLVNELVDQPQKARREEVPDRASTALEHAADGPAAVMGLATRTAFEGRREIEQQEFEAIRTAHHARIRALQDELVNKLSDYHSLRAAERDLRASAVLTMLRRSIDSSKSAVLANVRVSIDRIIVLRDLKNTHNNTTTRRLLEAIDSAHNRETAHMQSLLSMAKISDSTDETFLKMIRQLERDNAAAQVAYRQNVVESRHVLRAQLFDQAARACSAVQRQADANALDTAEVVAFVLRRVSDFLKVQKVKAAASDSELRLRLSMRIEQECARLNVVCLAHSTNAADLNKAAASPEDSNRDVVDDVGGAAPAPVPQAEAADARKSPSGPPSPSSLRLSLAGAGDVGAEGSKAKATEPSSSGLLRGHTRRPSGGSLPSSRMKTIVRHTDTGTPDSMANSGSTTPAPASASQRPESPRIVWKSLMPSSRSDVSVSPSAEKTRKQPSAKRRVDLTPSKGHADSPSEVSSPLTLAMLKANDASDRALWQKTKKTYHQRSFSTPTGQLLLEPGESDAPPEHHSASASVSPTTAVGRRSPASADAPAAAAGDDGADSGAEYPKPSDDALGGAAETRDACDNDTSRAHADADADNAGDDDDDDDEGGVADAASRVFSFLWFPHALQQVSTSHRSLDEVVAAHVGAAAGDTRMRTAPRNANAGHAEMVGDSFVYSNDSVYASVASHDSPFAPERAAVLMADVNTLLLGACCDPFEEVLPSGNATEKAAARERVVKQWWEELASDAAALRDSIAKERYAKHKEVALHPGEVDVHRVGAVAVAMLAAKGSPVLSTSHLR